MTYQKATEAGLVLANTALIRASRVVPALHLANVGVQEGIAVMSFAAKCAFQ